MLFDDSDYDIDNTPSTAAQAAAAVARAKDFLARSDAKAYLSAYVTQHDRKHLHDIVPGHIVVARVNNARDIIFDLYPIEKELANGGVRVVDPYDGRAKNWYAAYRICRTRYAAMEQLMVRNFLRMGKLTRELDFVKGVAYGVHSVLVDTAPAATP